MSSSMEYESASPYGGGLGYLIHQARNAFLASIEQELAPLSITAAQFIVVLGIAQKRATNLSEFSRLLGCDTGAMTRLLDRIESKGFIRRVRNLEDRRMVNIELTTSGKELQPRIMEAVTKVHRKLLQQFSDAELEQFQAFLRKIAANAQPKNF